jgi:hypothetical protein
MNLKILTIGCSLFLLLILPGSDVWFYIPHPTDQTLIRNFLTREAELNKLVEMGPGDIAKRKAREGETLFIAESNRIRGESWELNGTEKGYAYSTKELSPLVNSLDDIRDERSMLVYRKIKGNWYLYYEIWEHKPE